MDRYRLKNIIILILVLTDLFYWAPWCPGRPPARPPAAPPQSI